MINNLYELSQIERKKAIKLYAKSIINRKIADEVYPLQIAVKEFCQENEYIDKGIATISLEIFPQLNNQYYFGLCSSLTSKGKEVSNNFKSRNSLLAWNLFCLSRDGIDQFLKCHEQLIRQISFYSNFDINVLYKLSGYLENFDYEKVGEQIDRL